MGWTTIKGDEAFTWFYLEGHPWWVPIQRLLPMDELDIMGYETISSLGVLKTSG